ncbi:MAG TPA: DinB family protein [Gemmataceae bacterium]|nr:DinB family protein [Gemmataceae bacterium]
MDRSWIERYAAGATVPGDAIRSLGPAELNAFPVPGTWSIQQIIIHLMDSDLIGSDRMKRVAAEDNPQLIGYNETAFAKRLFPETLDPVQACEVFRLNRLLTAAILRQLSDTDFDRAGMHSERGRETLADLVQGYVEHLDHHMKFLREKRRLLGKPLA